MVSNFDQALAIGAVGLCLGIALTLIILFVLYSLGSQKGEDLGVGCIGATLLGSLLVLAFYFSIKAVSL